MLGVRLCVSAVVAALAALAAGCGGEGAKNPHSAGTLQSNGTPYLFLQTESRLDPFEECVRTRVQQGALASDAVAECAHAFAPAPIDIQRILAGREQPPANNASSSCGSATGASRDTAGDGLRPATAEEQRRVSDTARATLADVESLYATLEQTLELQYSKLKRELKGSQDELEKKIEEIQKQVAALAALAAKLEAVAAKIALLQDLVQRAIQVADEGTGVARVIAFVVEGNEAAAIAPSTPTADPRDAVEECAAISAFLAQCNDKGWSTRECESYLAARKAEQGDDVVTLVCTIVPKRVSTRRPCVAASNETAASHRHTFEKFGGSFTVTVFDVQGLAEALTAGREELGAPGYLLTVNVRPPRG